MRRAVWLFALGIAVAAISLGASGAVGAATAPSLRVVDTSPLTVRGLGFKPNERVTLVVAAGTRMVRHTHAGSGGAFMLRIGADINNCAGFSVTATGNHGSHATLKRAPGNCPVQ